jgi:LAO/AO transport system kinase
VGQAELDIMKRSDTTVVVLVPGAGDTIQTMKAGIMEIADIFVVNKADHQGADQVMVDLEVMLEMNPKRSWWQVPILATQAHKGLGIQELYEQIENHRQVSSRSGRLYERRKMRLKDELMEIVQRRIQTQLLGLIERDEEFSTMMEQVERGEVDPYSAAQEMLNNRSLVQSRLAEFRHPS